MTKYVGICGLARHGKDTIANVLVEEFGFTKLAFADRLKQIALAIDPFVRTGGDENFKYLSQVVNDLGWERAKSIEDVRRILQRIGTEAGRQLISDSLWVDLLEKEASKHDLVVVPDVRFPNEAQKLLELKAIMIHVTNPNIQHNGVGTQHASEQFSEQLKAHCHYLILNEGSISELHSKIRSIVKEILV